MNKQKLDYAQLIKELESIDPDHPHLREVSDLIYYLERDYTIAWVNDALLQDYGIGIQDLLTELGIAIPQL